VASSNHVNHFIYRYVPVETLVLSKKIFSGVNVDLMNFAYICEGFTLRNLRTFHRRQQLNEHNTLFLGRIGYYLGGIAWS